MYRDPSVQPAREAVTRGVVIDREPMVRSELDIPSATEPVYLAVATSHWRSTLAGTLFLHPLVEPAAAFGLLVAEPRTHFIAGMVHEAAILIIAAPVAFIAAGALIIILVWVYYSVQILLLGAEFAKAYTDQRRALRKSRQAT